MQDYRIPRLARALQLACLGVMILLPAVVALTPLLMDPADLVRATGLTLAPKVSDTQIWLAFATGLIPLAILLLTLNQMRHLFAIFAFGDALTVLAARRVRRIGQGFLALATAPLLIRPIQSVLLTWNADPGQREIAISLDSNMLGFALVSGLLIVIGWAMAHAAAMAEENRAFV